MRCEVWFVWGGWAHKHGRKVSLIRYCCWYTFTSKRDTELMVICSYNSTWKDHSYHFRKIYGHICIYIYIYIYTHIKWRKDCHISYEFKNKKSFVNYCRGHNFFHLNLCWVPTYTDSVASISSVFHKMLWCWVSGDVKVSSRLLQQWRKSFENKLKWNSRQKATKALFVIKYESNLRVNA